MGDAAIDLSEFARIEVPEPVRRLEDVAARPQ
jgi:hypothetical protein